MFISLVVKFGEIWEVYYVVCLFVYGVNVIVLYLV